MNVFRMIDLQDSDYGDGVLVDMEYELHDNVEKLIDIRVRNIINNVVGEVVTVHPMMKLAFAANFLQILEQEKNKE